MSQGDRGRGRCWPGGTGSRGDRGNKRGHHPRSSSPDHRRSFVERLKDSECNRQMEVIAETV